MSDQENEQQEGTGSGDVAPPSVEPLTPPDSDAPAPEPVGQTDETTNPEGDDAQTDTEATAPTQPGDEGVPFRPSSDFEEAVEQMPVPIGENAAGIDLSQRAVASTAIVGSPALAAETIVAQIAVNTDEQIVSGIMLRGFVAFTVGTSGTATTLRLRRTNVAGTVVATSGALTGGVAAGNLVADTILGFDTGAAVTGQVYVLTLQVTGGAAASTVSAVELDALVVQVTTPDQLRRNLGYFGPFMQAYGRADYPARAELYRDTLAYSGGRETDAQLYGQVTTLLGVQTPPA